MAENHQTAQIHPSRASICYIVRFPEPGTHYLSVEALLPTGGRPEVEAFLPVWTPGSYLIREYSRHLEAVSASDANGAPLALSKTRKNLWLIETSGSPEVRITYRVYCREM